MPGKSPQRLAKLARANAARKPLLTTEYDDLEPRFPGVSAAAKSAILELMDSKGFTQDNAENIMRYYLNDFRLSAIGMGITTIYTMNMLNKMDDAVCKMVGGIFYKHFQR